MNEVAVKPTILKPGDKIGVFASAGPVTPALFQRGVTRLEQQFRVQFDKSIFQQEGFLAAPDEQRLASISQYLADTDISALIAARGGWGTSRLLEGLEQLPNRRPWPWFVGSSDVTALLIYLFAKHHLCSIHGPMVQTLDTTADEDVSALTTLLCEEPFGLSQPLAPLCPGRTTAPFIGGNLTVLAHMVGTLPADVTNNCILFLEDVTEAPYRIDRCLVQLHRAGWLQNIAGIVVGTFTRCAPGKDLVTWAQVIEKNLGPLGVPVATGYPAAHGGRNRPFVHGAQHTLIVNQEQAVLVYGDGRTGRGGVVG